MKYKLLSVHYGNVNNIGDYVQALASRQFLPHLDGFLNREKMGDYSGERCCVFMNGWFMHEPSQWPPSENIKPFFVSFHLNASVKNEVLSEKGVEYLKKYSPVGCRDLNTVQLLRAKGIDAYFSGCMTLTLGEGFKSVEKNDKCYFVDPVNVVPRNMFSILFDIFVFVFNMKNVKKIAKKNCKKNIRVVDYIKYAHFFRQYRKYFSAKTLVESEYISQESSYYTSNFKTDESLLAEAERLVKLYARAKLVVTSRIHCALPCLGLETPVVYTMKKNDLYVNTCRMDGLIQLFNVVECDGFSLVPRFDIKSNFIDDCLWSNTDKWKQLALSLKMRCLNFIRKNGNESTT